MARIRLLMAVLNGGLSISIYMYGVVSVAGSAAATRTTVEAKTETAKTRRRTTTYSTTDSNSDSSSTNSSTPCSMCLYGGIPDYSSSLCTTIASQMLKLEESDNACTDLQGIAKNHCCNGSRTPPALVVNSCTFCEGYSSDFFGDTIAYGTTTCSSLYNLARLTEADSSGCTILNLQAARFCDCPYDGLIKCPICADGTDPLFPDNPVNVDGKITSCSALDESLALDDNDCPAIQAHGYFTCGCPTLPQLEDGTTPCSLCYDPDESFVDGVWKEDDDVIYKCSDKLVDLYASRDETCTAGQAEAALKCGCKTLPPPVAEPKCTLCPGGLSPVSGDRLLPDYEDVTCQQFSDIVPHLFDGGNCASLEPLRNLCQCPTEATCRLCNAGEELRNASLIVEGPTQSLTCKEVEDAAQYIKLASSIASFQDQCQNYRTEFAGQCCPGSSIEPLTFDFPTASPSREPSGASTVVDNVGSGTCAVRGVIIPLLLFSIVSLGLI